MSDRGTLARAHSGTFGVEGTADGTGLRILDNMESVWCLPLPPLLCDAINIPSVRSFLGTTQSQNSTNTSYAQGYVKSQGIAVSREVGVYRRDTKELVAKGTSGANGFFCIEWKGYSGKVAVIIFDNESSGYNAKIFDLLVTN